jgi:sucrose phosphorylase
MKKRETDVLKHALKKRLAFIYKGIHNDIETLTEQALQLVLNYQDKIPQDPGKWNEQDVVLITYGDSILNATEPALKTLQRFSNKHWNDAISILHILPFFPYSSDDGFSVIDYFEVREDLGSWKDIRDLQQDFGLAADLVINHISSRSHWFQNFLKNQHPGKDYFITENPDKDLRRVTRPRNTPLLTPYKTSEGTRYVWTTFSEDQVDLNFKNPEVFLKMLEALLFYLSQGIRIIRMDAIAFLWKEPGTSCLHLPQTHEIVKLYRDVFEYLGPHLVLLTETNVPNEENLSYFGNGDEAHMVYQFSLPPLLLFAFYTESAHFIDKWGGSLPDPPAGATYFNFTASHDGIGVRPLEGIVPEKNKQQLFENIRRQGGVISVKNNADGTTSPYEMNITYLDALRETKYAGSDNHIDRFISSQAVMTAFKGVPAFYIHSLLGTTNDYEGYEKTGRARTLNRKQWDEEEIDKKLDSDTTHKEILQKLKKMISVRKQQQAFHPDAAQKWIHLSDEFIAFSRISEKQEIICITNVTSRNQGISIESQMPVRELLQNKRLSVGYAELVAEPFQTLWLSGAPGMIWVSRD